MKTSFLLLLLTFFVFSLNAQQYQQYPEQFRDFTLKSKIQKVENSLYNKIKIIDLRKDTLRLGQGQFGLLNKKLTLTPKPSLAVQSSGVVAQAIGENSKNGELALFIRKFLFAERTAAFTEEGFCSLSADLYRKTDTAYYLLQSIDTLMRVEKMDVTKQMIRNGDSVFTCFITRNLSNSGQSASPLLFKEVVFADSIAKQKLKIYNSAGFVNGIYSTYDKFKNQTPDKNGTVTRKKDKIKSVKIISGNGIEQEIKSRDIYAVVADGIPFIATEFGYYPLKSRNGELVFIGKLPAPSKSGGVAASMMFFGLAGGVVAGLIGGLGASELNKCAYFFSQINYKNGEFVRLREILFGKDDSEESNWYYDTVY